MIMWVKQPNPVKGAPHFFTKSNDFSIFVGSKSDNKVSLHHTVFLLVFTMFAQLTFPRIGEKIGEEIGETIGVGME